MATNRTFTMIKPDAVEANNTGSILAMMTEAGFKVVALKYTKLSAEQAGLFFYNRADLVVEKSISGDL